MLNGDSSSLFFLVFSTITGSSELFISFRLSEFRREAHQTSFSNLILFCNGDLY